MAELTQTFELKIWVNDKEYSSTVSFVDDGNYTVNPCPNVRLLSIAFEPNKFTDVDLMDSKYSWLLYDEQQKEIIEAIERQLCVDFYRGRDELNSENSC